MKQNQDKLLKQNQRELETQLQNDLNALKKIEKWAKKIQERIESNRQKLDQLKTAPKNNLYDNVKADSTDKSPLFKTCLNVTNNLDNKKNDKTQQIFDSKDTINEKILINPSIRDTETLNILHELIESQIKSKAKLFENRLSVIELLTSSQSGQLYELSDSIKIIKDSYSQNHSVTKELLDMIMTRLSET